MKKLTKLFWASLLVWVLSFSFVAPAFAAGPLDGQVVFGDSFTLESNQILSGDLVVFGGSVTLEQNSRVEGNVAVLGGSADVAGTVTGDLVVFGGSVDLASTAVIDGELVAFGGSIDRAEGAIVRGSQVEGLTMGRVFDIPSFARVWANGHRYDWGERLFHWLWRILRALATVVLIAIIGMLVAIFMPQGLERVSQAMLVAPAQSWLIGFVTAILAALVGGILVATLCLAPFSAVIWLVALVAGVFGWVALGFIIGLQILERLRVSNATPVMSVVVGSVILSLVTTTLWVVSWPCLGWPFIILIGAFGLGAVVMTRFGTQEYVPASAVTPTAPQSPATVAADEEESTLAETEDTAEPSTS